MHTDEYARVKEIFLAASQLPETERDEYVAAACDGSDALLQEVRSLLDHHRDQTIIAGAPESTVPEVGGRPTSVSTLFQTVALAATAHATALRRCGLTLAAAAAAGLACVWWVSTTLQAELAAQQRGLLEQLLESQVAGLRSTLELEVARAVSWSRAPRFLEQFAGLDALWNIDDPNTGDSLRQAPEAERLRQLLQSVFSEDVRYGVWNRLGVKLADHTPGGESVGQGMSEYGGKVLTRVLDGKPVVMTPIDSQSLTKGYVRGDARPAMAVLVPILNPEGEVAGVFSLRPSGLEQRFAALLERVRPLATGECYAFNAEGLLISAVRHPEELRRVGLLPDRSDASPVLTVAIRDPGVDLTRGERAESSSLFWPRTKMVRYASAGVAGADLSGYRNYRGETVVGAWTWLPEYEFGVAVEIEAAELSAPLAVLRRLATALASTLGVGLLLTAVTFAPAGRRTTSQDRTGQKLGAYVLEEVIGSGGMGTVYRARHELLQRSAAVKLLKPELNSPNMIARFEREIRCAGWLRHPNTVTIYDGGRTPDGTLYYVMELLNGVDLQQMVRVHGAVAPARAVWLLRQICAALQEAHERQLVHRDITPQNIRICCTGGQADVVKLLDFGLVKRAGDANDQALTNVTQWAGTPRYMAPERILNPRRAEPQGDIYSVGAVAYFLLTGRELFDSSGVAPILRDALLTAPPAPSTFAAVPAALDQLVLSCLSKLPEDRPPSIAAVLEVLDRLEFHPPWDQAAARDWWRRHRPHDLAPLSPEADGAD